MPKKENNWHWARQTKCLYVCVCLCAMYSTTMYVYNYVCLYVYLYVCLYVSMYVSMCEHDAMLCHDSDAEHNENMHAPVYVRFSHDLRIWNAV